MDLDGTVAKAINRGPFEESKVFDDAPLPTIRIIKSLIQTGENIIFVSGRTDSCSEDTIRWLQLYITEEPILYMRKTGDFRGDDVVKKEIYETYIKPKYEVIGVFDDRLRVIRMWVELGLWVYNTNQKLEEF